MGVPYGGDKMGVTARWADQELLRKAIRYSEVSLGNLRTATVDTVGAVGCRQLAPRPPSSPLLTLPAPRTSHHPRSPLRVRAQTPVAKHCIIPRPPFLPSSSSSPLRARARMTHSPPPRSLVTQSHFRVQQDDPPRGRERRGWCHGASEWRM